MAIALHGYLDPLNEASLAALQLIPSPTKYKFSYLSQRS